MSATQIEGAYDNIRVAASAAGIVATRDDKARHNLAAIALTKDDPEAWLADVLDALGLRTVPTVDPAELGKPLQRTECGTDAGYQTHGRRYERPCTACKKAHNRLVNEQRKES